jgi:hypothetical protein
VCAGSAGGHLWDGPTGLISAGAAAPEGGQTRRTRCRGVITEEIISTHPQNVANRADGIGVIQGVA